MHIVPYLLSHPERERLVEAKRFALITQRWHRQRKKAVRHSLT
jgi:hypothetical protein